MKKRVFAVIIGIAALALMPMACSVDPEARLDRALDRYADKESGALNELEQALIRYASVESFDGKDLQSNGYLLYRVKGSKAEIYFPESLTLECGDNSDISHLAADDTHAVATDGFHICLFSGSGSHIQDETIGDKKSPVRSIELDGDSILYYMNARIYRYDIATQKIAEVTKELFPSPYTSYYKTQFARNGSLLGVCAGIAGSYSFSIINVKTGAVVAKNLAMSSSRFLMGEKTLYYMTGTSGKWELTQYDIASKSKKTLASFADLVDIVPAARGYVCETSAGLFTALYGSDRKRIPFAYKLAGSYKGRVLLQYKGTYYFIDMARLHEGLGRVGERAPELK